MDQIMWPEAGVTLCAVMLAESIKMDGSEINVETMPGANVLHVWPNEYQIKAHKHLKLVNVALVTPRRVRAAIKSVDIPPVQYI
jgi:hypothetical protein